MNQKDCVFSATVNVMGEQDKGYVPTKEQRKLIVGVIVEGITSGNVDYGKDKSNTKEVVAYSQALLTNWLKKDIRLNGGVKFEIKNPGSRAGSQDEQVKAMQAMLKVTTDTVKKAAIQDAIQKRRAELKPVKTVTVDMSKLPEDLRKLLEQN